MKYKVGFTAGAFDLTHAGHIMMFEECKDNCNYLIAALQLNPQLDRPQKNKPIEGLFERFIKLKSIKYIDEIIPYETEEDLHILLQILNTKYKNNFVRFVDELYKSQGIMHSELDIPIYFTFRKHTYSSGDLRMRAYQAELKKLKK